MKKPVKKQRASSSESPTRAKVRASSARAGGRRAATPPAHAAHEGEGVSSRREVAPSSQGEDLDVRLGRTVRRLREARGLSIQALARASGLSPGTIHKVENDAMVPSVTVVMKLARTLECAVGDLLTDDRDESTREFVVFRADRRPVLTFAEAPVRVHPIVGKVSDRKLEAGVLVVEPGARSSTEAVGHPGEKIYFVLTGSLAFHVDGRALTLGPGDALHLKARLPHRWENTADRRAEVLFAITPPLGSTVE